MLDLKQLFPELSSRNLAVIEHLVRHVVTIVPILHWTLFRSLTYSAVSKAINGLLVAQDYVGKSPLSGRSNCYFLGSRACQRLGREPAALGAQTLRTNLSANMFCSLGATERIRLSQDELKSQFPLTSGQLTRAHYIDIDDKGNKRLAIIRCDFGKTVGDCVKAMREVVSRRREQSNEWCELIDGNGLVMASLVTTREKAEGLAEALRTDAEWPTNVWVRLGIVPDVFRREEK